MREAGICPSAGVVVFNQLDLKKERKIGLEELGGLLSKVGVTSKSAEEVMARMDTNKDGSVDEKEWLEGLSKVMDLKLAMVKDIDPDTGKLKSLR